MSFYTKKSFNFFFIIITFLTLQLNLFSDPPDPVTDLQVVEVGFRYIKLKWTVPNSTSPVCYYEIRTSTYHVLSNETDWDNNSSETSYPYRIIITTSPLQGETTMYTITGLENGKTYFFAIKSSTSTFGVPLSAIDNNSLRPYGQPINSQPSQFPPIWPVAYVVVTSHTVIPFDWEDSTDNDILYGDMIKYELYYSTVETTLFSDPPTLVGGQVGVVGNITTSYVEVSPYIFSDNTTYYWRIKAVDSEGSFSWSYFNLYTKESRFVVNHTYQPPNSFSLLKPISSTTTSPVFFDWTDATDPDPQDVITYSLYISSQSASFGFVQQLSGITWSSYTLSSVFGGDWSENTTYFWYVVAEDSFSLKTFSATSWFVINNIEEPPSPNFLVFPGTTIYYQIRPENIEHVIFTLYPTFYWTLSTDPDFNNIVYYQLLISSYSDQPEVVNSVFYTTTRIYTTFYYLSNNILEDNTTYFWRVRVWDEPYSNYAIYSSTVFWFYTCVNNIPPSSALLLSPENNSTTSYFYPKFSWQLGYDSGYNATVSSQTLLYWTDNDTTTVSLSASTTFYIPSVGLKNNSTYYWQVITYDNGYPPPQLSTSSVVFKFYVKNSSPTGFSLLSPQNGSIIETQNIQLFWDTAFEPDNEPVRYTVVYSTNNFITFISSSEINSTNFVITDLHDNTTYYWYVYAYDIWGFKSFCTTTYYFVVDNIPQTPQEFNLIEPSNNSVLYNTYVLFYWETTSDPDPYETIQYELKISTENNFTSVVFSTKVVTSSFYLQRNVLEVNTTYYWTVTAVSSRSGTTTASNTPFRFFIFNTPPSTPKLSSPINKEIIYTSSVTLTWSTPVDYQGHEFYFELYYSSNNMSNWTRVIVSKDKNDYLLQNLVDDTTYYWYIVAVDTYQAKSQSDIYVFFTSYQNIAPSTPVVLSPANNEIITQPYTIKWSTSVDTDIFDYVTYKVEFSTDINFSNIIKTVSQTDTFFELKEYLLPFGTYYLRVVASDTKNYVSYSPVVKFFIPYYVLKIYEPQNGKVFDTLPIKFSFSKIDPVVMHDTITYKIYISTIPTKFDKEIVCYTTFYFIREIPLQAATYYFYIEANDSYQHFAKTETRIFVIPSTPPPAPKNIVYSTSTNVIEWQQVNIQNFWHYRIYFGFKIDKVYLIGTSTTTQFKLEKIEDGFYTVTTVNYFNVESVDNVYIKLFQSEQVDFYFSSDRVVLVSVPKSENITVSIVKLQEQEKDNVVLAYEIVADKQKMEKFCELQFVKPQGLENFSVEYYDGINWVSIPFYQERNSIYIKTQYLGKYRIVNLEEVVSEKGLTILGCSPKKRIITPNNDGKNDYVEFQYKIGSTIDGEIYNINFVRVCKLKRKEKNILYFDGKTDNGVLLPPGVYIYHITVPDENKSFNGTIVIKY